MVYSVPVPSTPGLTAQAAASMLQALATRAATRKA
jgi:hypothetical protein